MSIVTVNDANLTAIANAIREKNGLANAYLPSEMAAAITAIPTGGSGAEVATGVFTPISAYSTITLEHGLSGVPGVFYCIVNDEGVSQATTQLISFWVGCGSLGDIQFLTRSRNGDKIFAIGSNSNASYVSAPDATNIYFGGTNGTVYSWSVGYEYTWTAIYLGGGT